MCLPYVEQETISYIYDDMPALIPIHYTPDGHDCTMSIYNFKINEAFYYPLILSYSNILHHKINDVIVSSCILDYGVIETYRNGTDVHIYWPSIQDWINMYEDIQNTKYTFDNVFMGDVSLWNIITHD